MASPRVVEVRTPRLSEETLPEPRPFAGDLITLASLVNWAEQLVPRLEARGADTRRAISSLADWATRLAGIRTVATTYSMDEEDYIVLADAAGGAFTVTLPPTANSEGHEYTVKRLNAGANAVTVAPPTGTIDGAANRVLAAQYDSITVVSDGANWFIL